MVVHNGVKYFLKENFYSHLKMHFHEIFLCWIRSRHWPFQEKATLCDKWQNETAMNWIDIKCTGRFRKDFSHYYKVTWLLVLVHRLLRLNIYCENSCPWKLEGTFRNDFNLLLEDHHYVLQEETKRGNSLCKKKPVLHWRFWWFVVSFCLWLGKMHLCIVAWVVVWVVEFWFGVLNNPNH